MADVVPGGRILESREEVSLESILEEVPTLAPESRVLEVLDQFLADESLRVLPIVSERRPVGLINRHVLIEVFSRPFRRELFRTASIVDFMDRSPSIVELSSDLDEVAQVVVAAGLRHMLDGFIVVDAEGRYRGMGNAHDLLSEITQRKQDHLYQLAHFDALTELPNRILFQDRLSTALKHAQRLGRAVAVVFLDLDNFKRINDTLGHTRGDELLRLVGRRISGAIRESDTLARQGGDEFTLVLTNLRDPGDAAIAARKIRDQLKYPIRLGDQEVVVTTSLGIAVYPDDGREIEELLRKSDLALYEAKTAGRDTYRFYDKSRDRSGGSTLSLESDLRAALAAGQISAHFQPIVEAGSREVVGVEALARWTHPSQGPVSPATFVRLAEDTGLIEELGRRMTRSALAAAGDFESFSELWVAVNLSAREMRSNRFVRELLCILEESALRPERFRLELTEGLFLEPTEEILDKLSRLRDKGIGIAIDDFGTGCTSLGHLHVLPVDCIKIDRSFVSRQLEDSRIDALVKAMVDMAHALELEVVAEGVETAEQADRLSELGCDLLQGFHFARPAEPREAAAWLSARR